MMKLTLSELRDAEKCNVSDKVLYPNIPHNTAHLVHEVQGYVVLASLRSCVSSLSPQYVIRSNNELHQRAIPKQADVLTIIEDRDDSLVRQIQQVPTIKPMVSEVAPQPERGPESGPGSESGPGLGPEAVAVEAPAVSTVPSAQLASSALHPAAEAAASAVLSGAAGALSEAAGASSEAPHVQVETEAAREARLDRQWKELKVDLAELPDVYARLAKIKLTGIVVAAIFNMSACR